MNVPQPYSPPPMEDARGVDDTAREWWRWHFAGQVLAAHNVWHPDAAPASDEKVAAWAVSSADALIAELERER